MKKMNYKANFKKYWPNRKTDWDRLRLKELLWLLKYQIVERDRITKQRPKYLSNDGKFKKNLNPKLIHSELAQDFRQFYLFSIDQMTNLCVDNITPLIDLNHFRDKREFMTILLDAFLSNNGE